LDGVETWAWGEYGMVGVGAGDIPWPSALGGMAPGMPGILIDGCIPPGTAPGRAWLCQAGGAKVGALPPVGPMNGGACDAANAGGCEPGRTALGPPNGGGAPNCTCCVAGGPPKGGVSPPVGAV